MWRGRRQLANTTNENMCDKRDKLKFSVLHSIKTRLETVSRRLKRNDVSLEKLTEILYRPTDAASLGVVRALFGFCMVLDVVDERGLADIDIKWGDPMECHFPLIHGMKPMPLPWMILIFTVMWMGAFGIMLGLRFKLSCACFAIPYWYIFLLDKSYWNNHSYLYGIVAVLLWGTEADKYFGLDARRSQDATVPFWNYFILRFQFFALYFLAGLKKSDDEWLSGYAMTNLSEHWVFSPFKLFLTTEQTDFFIVHWFGFIFDLTVGFWMLIDKTRIPAMIFCTAFHLMNSRLFCIGMFPYVCLATMPLFCKPDWPRRLVSFKHTLKNYNNSLNQSRDSTTELNNKKDNNKKTEGSLKNSKEASVKQSTGSSDNLNNYNSKEDIIKSGILKNRGIKNKKSITRRQQVVVLLLLFHMVLQFFLPYSHFITKGYNNWVPGLYGYSWDMMVHVWDVILVVVKVHDKESNEDRYLDPKAWVHTDRWEKHGDMARQYAFCLKENLIEQERRRFESDVERDKKPRWPRLSSNLSIYIDVWCSLNGRFQQRMFNPNVDLLTVEWHPFKPISFLMPLLSQYNSYRYKLEEIQQHVYTWSNETDVLFVADFPEMHLDNYITSNFTNVTLTVLEGEVAYSDKKQECDVVVPKGSSVPIVTGQFHKVKTISSYPACYMYTYNSNKERKETERTKEAEESRGTFQIAKEIKDKIEAFWRALGHIANAFLHLVYRVPMIRRVQLSQ